MKSGLSSAHITARVSDCLAGDLPMLPNAAQDTRWGRPSGILALSGKSLTSISVPLSGAGAWLVTRDANYGGGRAGRRRPVLLHRTF